MKRMRWLVLTPLGISIAVALLLQQPGRAQVAQAGTAADSGRIMLTATTQSAVAESNSLITRMLQAGELTSVRIQDDPQIAGRQMQTLQQVYKGIPVEGGSVTLQRAGPATVSVFGTLFNAVSVDVTPAIAPIDAARIIEKAANAFIAFGVSPTLVVVPSPAGTFALTYKATVAYAITYYVDAFTGDVVRMVDARTMTPASARARSATEEDGDDAHRRHLPDQRYAAAGRHQHVRHRRQLDRPRPDLNGNNATDNDLASSATNTWTNRYVVDAHSNTGLTYDYFFRQHNWSGLDGQNRPMSAIVRARAEARDHVLGGAIRSRPERARSSTAHRRIFPVAHLDVAGHEARDPARAPSSHLAAERRALLVHRLHGARTQRPFGSTTHIIRMQHDHLRQQTILLPQQGDACSAPPMAQHAQRSDRRTSRHGRRGSPWTCGLRGHYEAVSVQQIRGGLRPIRSLSDLLLIPPSGMIPGRSRIPNHDGKNARLCAAGVGRDGDEDWLGGLRAHPIAEQRLHVLPGRRNRWMAAACIGDTLFSHAFYLAIEGGRDATSRWIQPGIGAAKPRRIESLLPRGDTADVEQCGPRRRVRS